MKFFLKLVYTCINKLVHLFLQFLCIVKNLQLPVLLYLIKRKDSVTKFGTSESHPLSSCY